MTESIDEMQLWKTSFTNYCKYNFSKEYKKTSAKAPNGE